MKSSRSASGYSSVGSGREAVKAEEIVELLMAGKDDVQRDHLMRFFKTGKGEYGEGDRFIGLKVPQTRGVVKEARLCVPLPEIEKLLQSEWHEVRLAGLLLLVEEMKESLPKQKDNEEIRRSKVVRREEIAHFYLKNARCANNWDLVDLSCEYILGPYIRLSENPDYDILYRLSGSDNLWEQRISIVTTLDFIRNGIFQVTLELADRLIDHPHDLIHKAIGWTLREIGKRDEKVMTDYLERNHARLPRTSLRYAIERLPERERCYWLKRR